MPTDSPSSSTTKKGRSPLRAERAATEYAVLALLLEGPRHGYELTRQFASRSELRQVCRLEMSMLYLLLRKLEKDGLIAGHAEPSSGQRSRRVVELTEKGRKEVEEWLSQPVRHTREVRFDFLIKLYFVHQQDLVTALRLVHRQLEYNRALYRKLEAQRQKINPTSAGDFERLVLDFRIEQNSAVLNWLQSCQQQLES